MSDSSPSGNRWEPQQDHPTGTAVAELPPLDPYPTEPAPTPAQNPTRSLRQRVTSIPRSALVAVGAALLVFAVGFGGFVAGRVTAPDGTTGQTGQTGQDTGPGGFDGRFDGDGDGQRGFPGQQQGTFPGQQDGSGDTSSNS